MGFNEKVHAYIAAKYYVYLKERFGSRGLEAFRHATIYYAEPARTPDGTAGHPGRAAADL